MRRFIVAAWLAALATPTLEAQVIRGRVTEERSTTPVAGAVVSLLAGADESTLASALTNPAGEYALRAPAPGQYRLAVKRIGVKRFVSVPFELATGETRVLDVPIDAVALTLPTVVVSGLCAIRPRELARISTLWEEARTALEATEISRRDRLIEARISRYAAELDPGSLRALFDWRSDAVLMVEQPFTSMSGDSLSAVGYWRQLEGDSVEYLAPDARVLASNAFLRDHCFSLAGAPRGRPDLLGIAFVPSRDRQLPDINGTVWLDRQSFELRFIEFRYSRLPRIPDADKAGGEVHFARLTSGAWIVDRWFIRMPQTIVEQNSLFPRRQLREEGGAVISADLGAVIRLATVTGVMRDSTGRPVEGAVVRALGTARQALSGADGSFRLDSLPPGGISLVAHTDGYDSFAMLAASRRVDLQPGRVHRVDLRAPNSGAMRREACPDPEARYVQRMVNQAALRLLMVDNVTSVPLPGVRFLVSWPTNGTIPRGPNGEESYRQALTDSRGAATFCDLPPGFLLEVSIVGATGNRTYVMVVKLNRNAFLGRVVSGQVIR